MTQSIWKYRQIGLVLLGVPVLSACNSVGHRKVPVDRFNYNAAIIQSRDEQMLLNLVRLRYLEVPNFLAVSSVITSYNYDHNIGVSSTLVDGNSDLVPDTLTGRANLAYSERPTITYTPLAGQDFAQRMFRPIPVETVFSLGHAGWPVDVLMAITLQRINDVENMGFGQVPAPGDLNQAQQFEREKGKLERFQRVLELVMVLLDNEALEVQQVKHDQSTLSRLSFERNLSVELQRLADELRSELKLESGRDAFRVTKRMTKREADEITIQSRSLMSIMSFLSRGVDVPEPDRDAGRVVVIPPTVRQAIVTHIPLHIRSQEKPPEDPYVAVRYRNHWFYIDHSDIKSKRTFATMQVLFQLAAPSGGAAAPLLTLPAGR